MANFFDQFDAAQPKQTGNVFDQFDQPAPATNFFDQFDAAPKKQAVEPGAPDRSELAMGEEFVKGVKRAATVDLPSLWEQAGVVKDVGAALTVQQRSNLFDKIDAGEIKDFDQLRGLDLTTSQARSYLAASPEAREKMRDRLTDELSKRKDFVKASVDTLKAYQEDAKKYQTRVGEFTDIGTPTDFANWLSSNVGSGAVNLAPIMLAAAATGGAGLLATGVAMGTAESVGNRLEALGKSLESLPPEERADAVIKRLEQTGGTDLAVGVISGALDTVLGPAAALVKQAAKKTAGTMTRTEAAKTALKETPKQMAEEALTGGLQEATQAAGKVAVGEREKFATAETLKDVINAAAAEAAGAPAGTAFNAARAALVAGKPPAEAKKAADRATILDTLAGEEDVARIDELTGGEGAGVVGKPGAKRPAGGVGGIEPSGVVSAGPDVGRFDQREEQPTAALTPEAFDDFTRQYTDLKQEALDLANLTSPTPADMRTMKRVQQDLASVVEANAGFIRNDKLADLMKNPTFDASQALEDIRYSLEAAPAGEPRAMAGDLFGGRKDVLDLTNRALSIGRQDVGKAVEYLQSELQRWKESMPARSKDSAWGRRTAPLVGMTGAEGDKNPDKVAELYDAKREQDIAAAIEKIQPTGQPRAMQGDMFAPQRREEAEAAAAERQRVAEEQKATLAARAAERETKRTEFGAPVEGEPVAEEAAPEVIAKEVEAEKAPDVTTEHVAQTEEGAQIKDFFAAIQPASATPAEQEKHATPKNSAAGALLEFDIAKPGETTSPGVQTALRYLANRVGGMDSFQELLSKLKSAPAELQSGMFKRAGLPDLTTRRGMEEFSAQVQEYLKQLPGKGEGVQISKRSAAAPATGEFRGVMPYTEDISQGVGEAVTYAPLESGKPRRPEQRVVEKKYQISDTKLRSAVRVLREMVQMGTKLTTQAKAAATYLQNTSRETFGDALRDVAFDLAMFELDPRNYGANSTFYNEGGKYAQEFRIWIEQNLSSDTVKLLDDLIADHKATAEANASFEKSITAYREQLDKFAETRREAAEKTTGTKVPKAPKQRSKRIVETELGEREETEEPKIPAKNLPREQGLYEVHPAIKRAIEAGDTNRVLELMAESKANPYYALLAQRLLDANITAKTETVGVDDMSPLSNDPGVPATMDGFLVALKDLVITTLPQNKQAEIVRQLESGKLRDIVEAFDAIGSATSNFTDGQKQLHADAVEFFNAQYGWVGKYDPVSDTMFLRVGSLTNHSFLHEAMHAAALHLIDKPDALTGIQRQGYDQLNELFNHAKGMLSLEGLSDTNIYGLTNLHEFVSEALTNPQFQATLRAIRYKASPFSLMNRFTQGVRKLFKIADTDTNESNVLNEVIFATDAMMMGGTAGKAVLTGAPAPLKGRPTPRGRPDSKTAIKNMMTSRSWSEVKGMWPIFYASLKADLRPIALGGLTLRQLADLVNKRIPQVDNFIRVAEDYLARKNKILSESGDITKRWQRMQAVDPDMSRNLGGVMHKATIDELDPDRATTAQKNLNVQLMQEWNALSPAAKQIYREVRNFYEKRYSEYKRTLNNRVQMMRKAGVSEATINDIRKEFEKSSRKGPYFPLMRYGRFWYQVGKGDSREYFMFESMGEKEQHLANRLAQNPELEGTLKEGDDYQRQMDLHARESAFLKAAFTAVDQSNMLDKQSLKDELYQTWLANQPETSFRNRFVHRKAVEGFSQDALRNFASSSFHMAYQMSRFEYSPELFSQIQAAKSQLKMRKDVADPANVETMRENNMLGDYVREMDRRLETILNPEDVGNLVSMLSNVGFIYYLTSVASAATNVVGGMAIGLPTLIGHQVRMNPKLSYASATVKALGQMKTAAMEIAGTGFGLERGPRLRDNTVQFPSLERSDTLSAVDRAAYNKFVGDGLIDITAAYDQSGLASTPTESYNGIRHRSMQVIAALFHNAERFNREVVAMSAFRAGMEKRAGYKNQQQAFTESIADAKDVTNQSMFDYSSVNKPRYMQHPIARVVLQFKQFPQQMTFYLFRNLHQSLKGESPEVKREARARFVGTMGMTAIFAGSTGLWGFSTVAAVANAVMNGLAGDDEEEPFDFELEYTNWAINTFGKNFGMFMARGAGNAAGIDLHSRVSLDGMWFRDGRKNLDEAEAWQQRLVDLLGPTVGLTVNAARAVDLYNQGHVDRAIETVSPGFLKQPLIAARYAREGVQTLKGDPLVESVGPMDLLMQSLGFRPALIAEIQYYNITKKGQEQEILKERTNLLNLFAISFMSNDSDTNEVAFEKMMKFNAKHPTKSIPADSIVKSIKDRMKKSAMTDHGLHIDKKLQGLIDETYIDKLREE